MPQVAGAVYDVICEPWESALILKYVVTNDAWCGRRCVVLSSVTTTVPSSSYIPNPAAV